MNRRDLAKSMLAASATGIALPGTLRAQTPSASPAASSGNIRIVEAPGIALALSPDGTMLAGIGDDERFYVWDAESFETIARSEPVPEISIIDQRSVTWAPDSTALAWSLDAARVGRDSDIYVFDIDSGTITNLTEDEPLDEAAVSLLELDPELAPLNVDMYPSWNAAGSSLVFARTVWDTNARETPTEIWSIPREGGEATQIATIAPYPMHVSSVWAGLGNGNTLCSTWTPSNGDPSDPHHGILLVTPDGEVISISTGRLASKTPGMVLVDVLPAARKASLVSMLNMTRLDSEDSPIWIEMDLDTGIPTAFEDVLSLPTIPEERLRQDLILQGAPAFMTDENGALTGYLYVTASADRGVFTLRHHDVTSGHAEALGTFENAESRANRVYPHIQIATDGTVAIFFTGNVWVTSIG